MPTSNIRKLSHLKTYLKHDIPKIEEIDSVIQKGLLESNIIYVEVSADASSDFRNLLNEWENKKSIQSIIGKIKQEIENQINSCSINTRNFKSNKVMNDIMTDMYTIQTEEIDEYNILLPYSIVNDEHFVSQHFLNTTNGKLGRAFNDSSNMVETSTYKWSELSHDHPIVNSRYNQTFINLQRLYANKGVGFMNMMFGSMDNQPHAIVMRNILGYILYNCNPNHYLNIYNQMKTVTAELIAMDLYKNILLKEEILDSDLIDEFGDEPKNIPDDRLRKYLQEMLGFVDKVLALLKTNDFKEHLLLNKTRTFTQKEYEYITSIIPILQEIVNDQITKNTGNKNLIAKIHYNDIFNYVWTSIKKDTDLREFRKLFGFIRTRDIGFEWENIKKNNVRKRNDLVFQSEVFQSMLYDFKFNDVGGVYNIRVTPDNLDERLYLVSMAIVIHNLTTDEHNKFNYVAPMKGFVNQDYIRNLYRIYSNVVKTLEDKFNDKFNDIMNKYIDCFRDFVFNKNSIALGLGAYLISLVILPYLPYKWINSQAIIQNTDLGVFHELSCFDSMYSIIEEMVNKDKYLMDCFHQAPYMLGFFSSINPSRRAGTCQDDALIQLMKFDMKNELYGMSMVNYPKITHWIAIPNTSWTGWTSYENGLLITHKNVITLGTVGSREKLRGKKPDQFNVTDNTPDIFERKAFLIATDLQKIGENNYQARANVFLAMTMAHVYRHTDIEEIYGENDDNGVAFIRKKESISSFEKAVLKYITDSVPMINTKRSNTTESSLNKFDFSSIEAIFDRYYDDIVQVINRTKKIQEAPRGGGGKPNPYIKVGKYNNRTIYKKKNTFYVRVKDSTTNKMIYKRLTKSMINNM